jgi:anti-sigma B factor antagonist
MVHIKRLQEEGADILAIVGEIDASSSIELDLAIAKSVGEGFTKILVDCSALEYIPRRGWGYLCRTSRSSGIRRSSWYSMG